MRRRQIIWLKIVIFFVQIVLCLSLSSIPMSIQKDRQLQSHKVTLVQTAAGLSKATIPFRNAKTTLPNEEKGIIMGIADMNYDANHYYSPCYAVRFDLTAPAITLSGMQIQMSYTLSVLDLKSVSVSILIISNEYRFAWCMMGFKRNYTNSNSYFSQLVTTFGTDIQLGVYSFLNAIFIQTNSGNKMLSYTFSFTTRNSTTAIVSTQISSTHFYSSSNFVILKTLVIKFNYIPSQEIWITTFFVTKTANTAAVAPHLVVNSEILMGLRAFTFTPGTGSLLNGLHWSIAQSGMSTILFTLDDQITNFDYHILIFNSYDCSDPNYPFQTPVANSTDLDECSDKCTASQYEYYSTTYQDYRCGSCHPLCIGCYQYAKCKSCIIGYVLQSDGTCEVDSSYHITTTDRYNPQLCSKKFNGCSTCTKYGHKCLSCLQGYYTLTSSSQSFSYTLGTGASAVSYSDTVVAVTCGACSALVPNCLTCHAIHCLTCASPYQLITPMICGIPSTPVVPVIKPCTDITRCKKCLQSALDDCLQCFDPQLTIVNGKCVSPCGDGLVMDQQICDDGNYLPYDGCSSDCMSIEEGWQCQIGAYSTKSYCQYKQPIPLGVLSIRKIPTSNRVQIYIQNKMPLIREWSFFRQKYLKEILRFRIDRFSSANGYGYNYSVKFVPLEEVPENVRILQQSSSTTVTEFNPDDYRVIELVVDYKSQVQGDESLNHQLSQVVLTPVDSHLQVFALSPQYVLTFGLYTDDNHIIQHFSQEYYIHFDIVKLLSLVTSILMMAIVVISLISCVIDGNNSRQILLAIETASVVQYSYYALLGVGELNPFFIAMAEGMKFVNGFDIALGGEKTKNRVLLGLGIQHTSIADNVNVSLILPIVFMFVGGIIMLVVKIRAKRVVDINKKQQNGDKIQGQLINQPQQLRKQQMSPGGQQKLDPVDNDQKIQHVQQNQEGRLQRIGKILLVNCGFGLYLFFLYKYLMSALIEVTMGEMQGMGMAVIAVIALILIGFLLLLFLRWQFFSQLTEKLSSYFSARDKIEMEDQQRKEQILNDRVKKKKIYFVMVIIQRMVSSFSLVVFFNSSVFRLQGIVPILLSIGWIIYMRFYDKRVYNPANKYRVYFNCCAVITIQVLLLARKYLLLENEELIGREESNYGMYLPYSLLAVLLLVEVIAIVFVGYSIKRVRCCQLQIQWERVDEEMEREIRAKLVEKKNHISIEQAVDNNPNNLQKNQPEKIQRKESVNNADILNDQTSRNLLNKDDDPSLLENKNLQHNQNIYQREFNSSLEEQYESCGNHYSQKSVVTNKQQQSDRESDKKSTNTEDRVVTKEQVKKQLKHLLKEMKIPQPSRGKPNHQNLQTIQGQDSYTRYRRGKRGSYHYTNQGVYNVYQQYDMI